jgi:hypothetical protein
MSDVKKVPDCFVERLIVLPCGHDKRLIEIGDAIKQVVHSLAVWSPSREECATGTKKILSEMPNRIILEG